MKYSKHEQAEAREREHLLRLLKPGDTIHTVCRHVSRSGMQRRIDCYLLRDGHIYLSGWIAVLLGLRRHDSGGIVIDGCGMDMGFSLVSSTSYRLWPDGFECIGEKPIRCPSNDHSNGDRDYTPHWHRSGEYALRQEWL